MKVAVTGGTGSWDRGVGPMVIKALQAAGHEVTNLDRAVPGGIETMGFIKVDLTDYGATFAALHGHDAVIQLAANGEPDWDHLSGAARFHVNTLIAYNVFQAACFLGMKRVVWASSETVLGFPHVLTHPTLLPTNDDDPPIPTSSYGISKAVTEDPAHAQALRCELCRPALLQYFSTTPRDTSPAMRRSPASGPIPWRGVPISGAMSTVATSPRPASRDWRPTSMARR